MLYAEEILDLVDANDCVIGQMERSEVQARNLTNFRGINVFLRRPDGKLWIPRRTATKRIYPLALDLGVGGHVSAGETYDQAFARELYEEVGLRLDAVDHRFLGKLTPHAHGVSAFQQVYLVLIDQAPEYNPNDFCEYFWFYPDELLAKVDRGEPCKSDLPRLVRHFEKVLIV